MRKFNGQEETFFYHNDKEITALLTDKVSEICGISPDDIMVDTHAAHISHARWLFWYAYRYVTNESYLKMSETLKTPHKKFVGRAIQQGVTKMSMMIECEPVWHKRWESIKQVIKQKYGEDENVDNTITICVPLHLKEKIKIQIKERK
jgi:hypothetical protein